MSVTTAAEGRGFERADRDRPAAESSTRRLSSETKAAFKTTEFVGLRRSVWTRAAKRRAVLTPGSTSARQRNGSRRLTPRPTRWPRRSRP